MRVAFFFTEKFPNYDLAFNLFREILSVEIKTLETYVKVGLWGFDDPGWNHPQEIEDRKHTIFREIFATGEGNIYKLNSNALTQLASKNQEIYVVLFDSASSNLAFALHNRMVSNENYLGFTQVISFKLPMHGRVFWALDPKFRIANGKIELLFSIQNGGEEVVDEMFTWIKDNYMTLFDSEFSQSVIKKDIGNRFTLLDGMDDEELKLKVEKTIYTLNSSWETFAEKLIYKIWDIAPEALDELLSSISILSKTELSPAECAQVAVGFRRCMEKITEQITPPLSTHEKSEAKGKGEYKFRLENYIKTKLKSSKPYQDYLSSELEEISTRVEKLYNLGNKGVHENYVREVFEMVGLKLVLLMYELLYPLKVVKPITLYESGIFEE